MHKMRRSGVYCFKARCNGDSFVTENGTKEFFIKDYKVKGLCFILVDKQMGGCYKLLKTLPIVDVVKR
jgi:hypothetical protein